jgi:hypothetical protein
MLDNRYEYRDGHFVSQRVSQVVAAIQEYAPDVEVQFIPQGQRKDDTAAYRLVHHPDGGEPYTIFYVKNDEDFDARVLKRLMMGDQRNGPTTISDIEASEAAAEAVARQRFLDQLEEANEISQAVLKSPKDTYKVNDNLIIHQTKPFSRKLRRKYLK